MTADGKRPRIPARRASSNAPARPTPDAESGARSGADKGRSTDGSPKRPASLARKGKSKAKRTTRQRVIQVLLWAGIAGASLVLIGIVLIALYYNRTNLPDPNAEYATQTTTLYYRDGTTKLGSLSVQNRTPLSAADIPQTVKDAILAAEDRSFYSNVGISVPGMIRAAYQIVRGGDLQSGSTLTQQYIKVYYLTSDQKMTRKLKELVLAIKMTNQMPKDQILAGYLNTVYYGRGAYGIQAASRAFFNIDAQDLNVQQAVVLACVVNAPSLYEPNDANNIARLTARYDYVLDGMAEMGTLTPEAAAVLKGTLPPFPDVPAHNRYGGPQGFLIKMAEAELAAAGLSPAQVNGGGLTIVTTFDPVLQQAMQESVTTFTSAAAAAAKEPQDPARLHPGMVSIKVGTGEVLALYGGPDYVSSQWNWATTPRPAGSTFKPYAFIAGERGGFSLTSVFKGSAFKPSDGLPLTNSENQNYGPVTLLKAVQLSINTAFVDLVEQLPGGPAAVIKAATDAGLTRNSTWDDSTRIALGRSEVSPLEQAAAYATFANNGVKATTHVVVSATDPAGVVLYRGPAGVEAGIEPTIARDLNTALASVVDEGTGRAAKVLGVPNAGKTGTVQADDGSIVASWYVGYTTEVSTAIMWVVGNGNEDLQPYRPPGTRMFFASGYPLQTWIDYMQRVIPLYPGGDFEPPAKPTPTSTSTTPTSTTAVVGPSEDPVPPPVTTAPPPPTSTTAPPVTSTEAPPPPPSTSAPPPEETAPPPS